MLKTISAVVFLIGILLVLLKTYIKVKIEWYVLLFPFAGSIFTFILSYINIRIPKKAKMGIILFCYTLFVIALDRMMEYVKLDVQLWMSIFSMTIYLIIIFIISFYQ